MSSSNPPESSVAPSQTPPGPRPRWPIGRWLLTLFVVAAIYVGFIFLTPKSRAQFKWAAAVNALEAGKVTEAKQLANEALAIFGDDASLQRFSAELFYRVDEPEKANEHLEQAIELADDNPYILNSASFLFARLGEHEKSLALADKIVELAETQRTIHMHRALNQRAYAIALAAADGQATPEQIKQGLIDINQALSVFVHEDTVIDDQIANYLDTRGYLELFAGAPQQGLEDLNKAIAVYELVRRELLSQAKEQDPEKVPVAAAAADKEFQGVLAVLYSHRAAIYEKLKQTEAAEEDLARAKELGLSRKKGIW
ncbi:hypothetical protein [Blastopirellula marina]|uniref:Uncharacterized protein n=1 Tax=Blastopirellula marina TaxID=124 RepID=A0A2S8F865_9BACT|nr:hypothetical protein [Blastopirellula marina]PQO28124.1 hypothetical protein C5Y98_24775 [Blastopirellula marina]PTL41664.1 hypothetical protein C5Y97_24790 [Blastopirellula marina]